MTLREQAIENVAKELGTEELCACFGAAVDREEKILKLKAIVADEHNSLFHRMDAIERILKGTE